MSQNPPQPQFYSYQPETNGLAIAGCVISIIGFFFTGGLLCPIGLIVSLVALGKPHGKGWAWTGVILGFLGTCGGLILVIAIVMVGIAAVLAVLGFALISQPEQLEITGDMVAITIQAEKYKKDNNVLPANLGLLNLSESNKNDPWGNPYRYLLDDSTDLGFDLISDGGDGKSGSSDDIYLSKLDKAWENAFKDFERKLESYSDSSSDDSDNANETDEDEGNSDG